MERSGRGLFETLSRPLLERLRKATKISAKMPPPDRYLNLGSPEYKAGLLTTRPDRCAKNENTADWGLFDHLTSV
jgi:hypothetical protein